MNHSKSRFLGCLIFASIFALCVSCKNQPKHKSDIVYQQKRIVIWTSCREFAQYIELFNRQHKDNCAILVYKEVAFLVTEKDAVAVTANYGAEIPEQLPAAQWMMFIRHSSFFNFFIKTAFQSVLIQMRTQQTA